MLQVTMLPDVCPVPLLVAHWVVAEYEIAPVSRDEPIIGVWGYSG